MSGIEGAAALRSSIAGEVDPYRLTHRLLQLASSRGLRVFDRTAGVGYAHSRSHVTVKTDRGPKVKCRAVFFATGYETIDFLPEKIVTFKSTYAFASEPLPDLHWWKDRSLLWGTGDPYPYMRTSRDNRVIIGGEDDGVLNPQRRDRQIARKTTALVRRFNALSQADESSRHSDGLACLEVQGTVWRTWGATLRSLELISRWDSARMGSPLARLLLASS